MEIRRRDFLKTLGISGAGLLVFNPVIKAFASTKKSAKAAAVGKWIPSACSGCTTWCPIQVYVQDGRAVKVRGNKFSITNPGTLCPKGHLAVQECYDPDRIKVPMKRVTVLKGKTVNPQFVPITWSEAIDTIATKLYELRQANEPEKFMYLRGRYNNNTDMMYSSFTKIFGTPNSISHSSICAEAEKIGYAMTEKIWGYRDYDLENTKYLLLWGVDPFRSNRQPPNAMAKWPTLLKNAIVSVIDPVFTGAAAKANNWLPVKPGEDGALASALAHEILTRGLWHKEFVGNFKSGPNLFVKDQVVAEADFAENYTSGLVKWWNLELKNKNATWAEPITGIPASTITKMAIEMGANAPNVCIWNGPGPTMAPRGAYTGMAINALNGLLGSIRNVGGVLKQPSKSAASTPAYASFQDTIATTGVAKSKMDQKGTLRFPAIAPTAGSGSILNNVANAMIASNPYAVKVVIANFINVVHSATEAQRWETALKDVPFMVHISTHISETSMYADILLPAAFSGLERWGHLKSTSNRFTEIDIQSPAATRLFDVKDDETEIPYLIAEKLKDKGFTKIYDYYSSIKDPETLLATSSAANFEELITKFYCYPAYNGQGDKWATWKLKGVSASGQAQYFENWNDFGGANKKFEFYSDTLKKELDAHALKFTKTVDEVMVECNYTALGDLAFVPHYEPPLRRGTLAQYPFVFIDLKSRFNREGRSQNLPFYYQFKKLDPGDMNWDDCIRINPDDAATLGIVNGDLVKVTSIVGNITVKARLFEGIRPGTVAKTFGQGHTVYGRFASKDFATFTPFGGNNNLIIPDEYERLSSSTARNGGFTLVKIEKV